ncbi:hypothetical protein PGT21_006544 [Puccinia graminis f. sp. tritici]|uniref:Uncharacterized protein n=1 Tax=Puccinia graminis f. sp. tritici TaxID=56615 RepID=A0A5B0Q5A7_PUCGR|nr:hypothetical protein PGT21_006544 [Puccinia graminis f. sp. tritici]
MRSNHQPGSHNSMILDNRLTWLRSWLSPLTAIREFESLPQIPHEFLAQTSANQKTKKAAYLGFAAAQCVPPYIFRPAQVVALQTRVFPEFKVK